MWGLNWGSRGIPSSCSATGASAPGPPGPRLVLEILKKSLQINQNPFPQNLPVNIIYLTTGIFCSTIKAPRLFCKGRQISIYLPKPLYYTILYHRAQRSRHIFINMLITPFCHLQNYRRSPNCYLSWELWLTWAVGLWYWRQAGRERGQTSQSPPYQVSVTQNIIIQGERLQGAQAMSVGMTWAVF